MYHCGKSLSFVRTCLIVNSLPMVLCFYVAGSHSHLSLLSPSALSLSLSLHSLSLSLSLSHTHTHTYMYVTNTHSFTHTHTPPPPPHTRTHTHTHTHTHTEEYHSLLLDGNPSAIDFLFRFMQSEESSFMHIALWIMAQFSSGSECPF